MSKKKKSNRRAQRAPKKDIDAAKNAANDAHEMMGKITREHSHNILKVESAQLVAKLAPGCALSTQDASAVVEKLARLAGTDSAMNATDPYGDGDQSQVAMDMVGNDVLKGEPQRQIIREVFSAGGDLESYLKFRGFSPFAMACCFGHAKTVEKILKGTEPGSDERQHLLERRESGMRFTPLLLAIAISKVKSYCCQITGTRIDTMDHVSVVKILLRYGARPDCKELTGKTAAHYGAGSRATVDTLTMMDYILEATKSCHYFGQNVTLRNLKKIEYNGIVGVLGGFDADTGRRDVTLKDGKQLSLLTKNIFSNFEQPVNNEEVNIYNPSRNLLNDSDRIGMTSLHEVYCDSGGRIDVAEFLVERHVSIDVAPPCGNTVRKLAYLPTPFGTSQMSDIIRKYIVKIEQVEVDRCWGCTKKVTSGGLLLLKCGACKKAIYCGRECQKKDWRIHKNDCQNVDENYSIKLAVSKGRKLQLHNIEGKHGMDGDYKRPNSINADERFWIKIQIASIKDYLLVYDKSRSCHFHIEPGTSGHLELRKRVIQEKAFNGKKQYFEAAFDASGNCRVYPNLTSTTEKW